MHPHLVFPLAIVVLGSWLAAAPQSAAADEALIVERRGDMVARNRLARDLDRIPMRLIAVEMEPAVLGRLLASATGDRVNFIVVDRASELEPITLELPRMPVLKVMNLVQRVSDLRFVYRDGMVLLRHEDQVKPLLYTQVYDLRSATMPLRNSRGPVLGVRVPGEEDIFGIEEEASTTTVSGFSSDDLEDLVRKFVTPESWDANGVSLSNAGGVFTVRHTALGHLKLREALIRFGVLPGPVLLRARPVIRPRR